MKEEQLNNKPDPTPGPPPKLYSPRPWAARTAGETICGLREQIDDLEAAVAILAKNIVGPNWFVMIPRPGGKFTKLRAHEAMLLNRIAQKAIDDAIAGMNL